MAGPIRSESLAGSSLHADVQPPRPQNSFMLYRSYHCAIMRSQGVTQGALSRVIAEKWKNESEETKRHWEQRAEEEKRLHHERYPNYRYCPMKKEDKMRAKEERKQNRKKPKARDLAPPAGTIASPTEPIPSLASGTPQPLPDTQAAATNQVPPPVMPYVAFPYLVPTSNPAMAWPQYMLPYSPEALYGAYGSSPISAAPSPPPPYELSESSLGLDATSSNPSAKVSRDSESRTPSAPSNSPSTQFCLSPIPSSHNPSPSPYATQPLLFQASTPSVLSLTENPASSVWNNAPGQPSVHVQNSDVVIVNIAVNEPQRTPVLRPTLLGSSSSDTTDGLGLAGDKGSAFSVSNIGADSLVSQPQGQLEIAMGPPASIVDYNQQLFAEIDYDKLEQHLASLTNTGSRIDSATEEDLGSLFHVPNDPEAQVYTAACQRQPSFTQDMMDFFNFEAAAGCTEDFSSTISPTSLPTAVAQHQVRVHNLQDAAAMPILSQMTNVPVPAIPSNTPYVPPAGAIYSSTRRVGGSWKVPFDIPSQQESALFWTFPTN